MKHVFNSLRLSKLSLALLVITLLLTCLGSIFVLEASAAESLSTFGNQYVLLKQHLIGLSLGFFGLGLGIFLPHKFWINFSPIFFILSLVLLILVFIPGVGMELNGAHRWINILGLTIQPVEFLKFSLCAFYARWLSYHQRFGPFLFLTGAIGLLILLQPDLGSTLLIISLATSLYFLAGGRLKNILITLAVVLPIAIALIFTSSYRLNRLKTFLDPSSDPLGSSFQIRQITLALGRGGLVGQGLGNSSQKFAYIPEASSDSIFAIVGEELGFVGTSVIIMMFVGFLSLGFKIVGRVKDKDIQLLGLGCLVWISLQTLFNLGAVAALIPLTGMPLPFFSYGRSSQVMIFLATGYIIGLGKQTDK
ncbi:MAG: putative peptidoglycan glycosyltransferase FtsW [Patescibacteria group bacterium]